MSTTVEGKREYSLLFKTIVSTTGAKAMLKIGKRKGMSIFSEPFALASLGII